jgi:hypothetical protein
MIEWRRHGALADDDVQLPLEHQTGRGASGPRPTLKARLKMMVIRSFRDSVRRNTLFRFSAPDKKRPVLPDRQGRPQARPSELHVTSRSVSVRSPGGVVEDPR